MQGRKHYQEKLFLEFRLSDHVPEDNFYRRLHRSLDFSFLYQATEKYYGKEGKPGIDPAVFFKLLLTGYLENLQSDRSIIENARLRLDILLFIGYDLDEPLPWHSTLSRTRQLYGEEVFRELFQQVLGLCINKGMVAGKRQAIDSVLVKANASLESLTDKTEAHQHILADASAYLDALEQAASQELQQPQQPQQQEQQEQQEQQAIVRLHPTVKKSNKNRYSPTDPDSRLATKPGKPSQLNYLGQVSVDTAHHLITNIEAQHADKRDSECLLEVLTQTVENLAAHGLAVEEVLADTNYSSASVLKAIEEQQISAYIPNAGQYKSQREGFTYDEQGDYYQCRQGVKLPFKRIKSPRRADEPMRYYASSSKECKDCPFKEECIGKGRYKTLSHTVHKPLFDQMEHRMQSRQGRWLRRLRQSTVEPVIGTLTGYLGMKKVRSRGIRQASKEMLSAAIAYNLKKYLKWIKKKPSLAIAMPLKVEKAVQIGELKHLRGQLAYQMVFTQAYSQRNQWLAIYPI